MTVVLSRTFPTAETGAVTSKGSLNLDQHPENLSNQCSRCRRFLFSRKNHSKSSDLLTCCNCSYIFKADPVEKQLPHKIQKLKPIFELIKENATVTHIDWPGENGTIGPAPSNTSNATLITTPSNATNATSFTSWPPAVTQTTLVSMPLLTKPTSLTMPTTPFVFPTIPVVTPITTACKTDCSFFKKPTCQPSQLEQERIQEKLKKYGFSVAPKHLQSRFYTQVGSFESATTRSQRYPPVPTQYYQSDIPQNPDLEMVYSSWRNELHSGGKIPNRVSSPTASNQGHLPDFQRDILQNTDFERIPSSWKNVLSGSEMPIYVSFLSTRSPRYSANPVLFYQEDSSQNPNFDRSCSNLKYEPASGQKIRTFVSSAPTQNQRYLPYSIQYYQGNNPQNPNFEIMSFKMYPRKRKKLHPGARIQNYVLNPQWLRKNQIPLSVSSYANEFPSMYKYMLPAHTNDANDSTSGTGVIFKNTRPILNIWRNFNAPPKATEQKLSQPSGKKSLVTKRQPSNSASLFDRKYGNNGSVVMTTVNINKAQNVQCLNGFEPSQTSLSNPNWGLLRSLTALSLRAPKKGPPAENLVPVLSNRNSQSDVMTLLNEITQDENIDKLPCRSEVAEIQMSVASNENGFPTHGPIPMTFDYGKIQCVESCLPHRAPSSEPVFAMSPDVLDPGTTSMRPVVLSPDQFEADLHKNLTNIIKVCMTMKPEKSEIFSAPQAQSECYTVQGAAITAAQDPCDLRTEISTVISQSPNYLGVSSSKVYTESPESFTQNPYYLDGETFKTPLQNPSAPASDSATFSTLPFSGYECDQTTKTPNFPERYSTPLSMPSIPGLGSMSSENFRTISNPSPTLTRSSIPPPEVTFQPTGAFHQPITSVPPSSIAVPSSSISSPLNDLSYHLKNSLDPITRIIQECRNVSHVTSFPPVTSAPFTPRSIPSLARVPYRVFFNTLQPVIFETSTSNLCDAVHSKMYPDFNEPYLKHYPMQIPQNYPLDKVSTYLQQQQLLYWNTRRSRKFQSTVNSRAYPWFDLAVPEISSNEKLAKVPNVNGRSTLYGMPQAAPVNLGVNPEVNPRVNPARAENQMLTVTSADHLVYNASSTLPIWSTHFSTASPQMLNVYRDQSHEINNTAQLATNTYPEQISLNGTIDNFTVNFLNIQKGRVSASEINPLQKLLSPKDEYFYAKTDGLASLSIFPQNPRKQLNVEHSMADSNQINLTGRTEYPFDFSLQNSFNLKPNFSQSSQIRISEKIRTSPINIFYNQAQNHVKYSDHRSFDVQKTPSNKHHFARTRVFGRRKETSANVNKTNGLTMASRIASTSSRSNLVWRNDGSSQTEGKLGVIELARKLFFGSSREPSSTAPQILRLEQSTYRSNYNGSLQLLKDPIILSPHFENSKIIRAPTNLHQKKLKNQILLQATRGKMTADNQMANFSNTHLNIENSTDMTINEKQVDGSRSKILTNAMLTITTQNPLISDTPNTNQARSSANYSGADSNCLRVLLKAFEKDINMLNLTQKNDLYKLLVQNGTKRFKRSNMMMGQREIIKEVNYDSLPHFYDADYTLHSTVGDLHFSKKNFDCTKNPTRLSIFRKSRQKPIEKDSMVEGPYTDHQSSRLVKDYNINSDFRRKMSVVKSIARVMNVAPSDCNTERRNFASNFYSNGNTKDIEHGKSTFYVKASLQNDLSGKHTEKRFIFDGIDVNNAFKNEGSIKSSGDSLSKEISYPRPFQTTQNGTQGSNDSKLKPQKDVKKTSNHSSRSFRSNHNVTLTTLNSPPVKKYDFSSTQEPDTTQLVIHHTNKSLPTFTNNDSSSIVSIENMLSRPKSYDFNYKNIRRKSGIYSLGNERFQLAQPKSQNSKRIEFPQSGNDEDSLKYFFSPRVRPKLKSLFTLSANDIYLPSQPDDQSNGLNLNENSKINFEPIILASKHYDSLTNQPQHSYFVHALTRNEQPLTSAEKKFDHIEEDRPIMQTKYGFPPVKVSCKKPRLLPVVSEKEVFDQSEYGELIPKKFSFYPGEVDSRRTHFRTLTSEDFNPIEENALLPRNKFGFLPLKTSTMTSYVLYGKIENSSQFDPFLARINNDLSPYETVLKPVHSPLQKTEVKYLKKTPLLTQIRVGANRNLKEEDFDLSTVSFTKPDADLYPLVIGNAIRFIPKRTNLLQKAYDINSLPSFVISKNPDVASKCEIANLENSSDPPGLNLHFNPSKLNIWSLDGIPPFSDKLIDYKERLSNQKASSEVVSDFEGTTVRNSMRPFFAVSKEWIPIENRYKGERAETSEVNKNHLQVLNNTNSTFTAKNMDFINIPFLSGRNSSDCKTSTCKYALSSRQSTHDKPESTSKLITDKIARKKKIESATWTGARIELTHPTEKLEPVTVPEKARTKINIDGSTASTNYSGSTAEKISIGTEIKTFDISNHKKTTEKSTSRLSKATRETTLTKTGGKGSISNEAITNSTPAYLANSIDFYLRRDKSLESVYDECRRLWPEFRTDRHNTQISRNQPVEIDLNSRPKFCHRAPMHEAGHKTRESEPRNWIFNPTIGGSSKIQPDFIQTKDSERFFEQIRRIDGSFKNGSFESFMTDTNKRVDNVTGSN